MGSGPFPTGPHVQRERGSRGQAAAGRLRGPAGEGHGIRPEALRSDPKAEAVGLFLLSGKRGNQPTRWEWP